MALTINWLPKQPDKVITMGKEKQEDAPPPAVPIADVEEKPLKEAATPPPVVETVHKEKRSRKPKEGQ